MSITLPTSLTQAAAAAPTGAPASEAREQELRTSAREFEEVFVRQMLQYAGLAEAFGAEGQQTDAFSTFLLDHLAEKIVDQGGFGLAETFYNRLATFENEASTARGRQV